MSVVNIPILNRNYPMGCEDGQEQRLINLAKLVDEKAHDIVGKIGPLPENMLLATLCIVLADEMESDAAAGTQISTEDLEKIITKIRHIAKLCD